MKLGAALVGTTLLAFAPPPAPGETTQSSDAPSTADDPGPTTARDEFESPPASATTATATQQSASGHGLEDPALSNYYTHLESAGLLDNREATMEEIEGKLQAGQDKYIRGDALGSAVLLFELTQNPRFQNFADLPIMSSVRYHLGVALQAYGADKSALAAFQAVVVLGPDDAYFRPALRRQVDLALESKDFARGLETLDATFAQGSISADSLEAEDASERHYLEARALNQQGDVDAAMTAYDRVDLKSRFYTAALYLQGVVHSRRREFREAEAAFCEVVGGESNQTTVYTVDSRYFPIRDLAHFGLGRVAHEERRHGHAFYHYFQVPQESEQLPQALFEASWTMAEMGEHGVAKGLVDELEERFPDSPQTAEAELLSALLRLYDCDFRGAEKAFTDFIDDMAPVADHIEEIRRDQAKIQALHRELQTLRAASEDLRGELPSHRLLLYMLDEDPTYARITRDASVLRREAGFGSAIRGDLMRLRAQLQGDETAVSRAEESDLIGVIGDLETLEVQVAGLDKQIRAALGAGATPESLAPERETADRLRKRIGELQKQATRLARAVPDVGRAQTKDLISTIDRDIARIDGKRAMALGVAEELDEQAANLAGARLGRLRQRIEDMMGEARMGRIDSVLGAKKKLEIEVQSMAAGRFPSELFGKLQIEGMVGDDEEFWPYEGEYWSDEYEGYR